MIKRMFKIAFATFVLCFFLYAILLKHYTKPFCYKHENLEVAVYSGKYYPSGYSNARFITILKHGSEVQVEIINGFGLENVVKLDGLRALHFSEDFTSENKYGPIY